MRRQENENGKEGRKIAFAGLCITALGILGYVGWDKFKKYRDRKREESDPENFPSVPSTDTNTLTPYKVTKPKATDDFPLKQGSKGKNVKALQDSLIEKYGKAILPKYGADGSFGKEMSDSLKSKGLPLIIDENTFNVLVKSREFNAKALAGKIFQAALTKNFNEVIAALKTMKSTDDYSAVGENFKQLRLNGVRQTLVNALMNLFSGDQKQKIQLEFLRMGLKFDGNKWALSGITPLRRIVTIVPTLLWKDKFTAIKVPANLLLGYALLQKKGFTVFQSIHNQKFLVKTNSIKYL